MGKGNGKVPDDFEDEETPVGGAVEDRFDLGDPTLMGYREMTGGYVVVTSQRGAKIATIARVGIQNSPTLLNGAEQVRTTIAFLKQVLIDWGEVP